MNIIPSIDLMNGKCVRLCKGKQDTAVYYNISPIDYINILASHGFSHVHIVDLDNAFGNDNTANKIVIKDILSKNNHITIDVGGGIHTEEQIREYLQDLDVLQICLGTLSIENPKYVKELVYKYGGYNFIMCADVYNEYIAINGWQNTSDVHILEYIDYWHKLGVYNFICTDIEKDGTLSGPNILLYSMLNNEFKDANIIVSGGISDIKDIEALSNINTKTVIIGKALFENKINLKELSQYAI